jgi:alpha/beta superfamily hydrolase
MKNYIHALWVLLLWSISIHAKTAPVKEELVTLKGEALSLYGSLLLPNANATSTLAIIIAGSGPTDRNGNNMYMVNDHLKKLAQAISKEGIATLRYDKRSIGESKSDKINETNLRFTDYVEDAKAWIAYFRKDKRFTKIVIIGHSEGSTIGALASTVADAYVSIAGPGRKADDILREQLKAYPTIYDDAVKIMDSLNQDYTVQKVSPTLMSVFRPSVQPYIKSWFKISPIAAVQALSIPTLILQGSSDLQVGVKDAELLVAASKNARLNVIPKMNHIFVEINGDEQANKDSYTNASLPISSSLSTAIVQFIKAL